MSGVAATRRSPAWISLGMPIFIDARLLLGVAPQGQLKTGGLGEARIPAGRRPEE